MKQKSSIIYIYNSYADPLFLATLYQYLIHEGQRKRFRFHLITYEQKEFELSEAQKMKIRADLEALNITWHPLQWHSGSFKLFKKAFDLLSGMLLVLRLRLFKGARSIISLGTVSGSFAYLFSQWFGLKYYMYQYEPHSEFLVDFGLWQEGSLQNRILKKLEYKTGMHADIIATGTTHMMARLKEWKSPAQVYRLPSCVDENRFRFSEEGRKSIREKYNISPDKKVVLYLGKLGGIYYHDELGDLFRALQDNMPELFFMIVSPNPEAEIREIMDRKCVHPSSYVITRSGFDQVPAYLSAADLGVVAVPPLPSQRFRSPIKVGEYLCCGLPYIVTPGISEDDTVAVNNRVGVVLEDFTNAAVGKHLSEIQSLLEEDRATLRSRCRTTGVAYRGISHLAPISDQIFDELYRIS